MSNQKNLCEITDNFIQEYLVERKKSSNNWLGFQKGLGRILNKEKTFHDLRKIDFELSNKFTKKLSDEKLSYNELIEMVTLVKNHILALNFRVKYITLIITIGVPTYLLYFKNQNIQKIIDFQTVFLLLIFLVFGSAMYFERWNINQHSSKYNEIVNIIQAVIKEKS